MSDTVLSVLLPEPSPPAALQFALAEAGIRVVAPGEIDGPVHAALLLAPTRTALAALRERSEVGQLAFDLPLVIATAVEDAAIEADLLRLGVQQVAAERDVPALARALRQAVVRRQVERSARSAYATDLATGLPHEAQLIEHMTQLLALREREPAPLVVIALRIEGYARASTRLGGEAANVLRRKVAVRLRGGLRASDIVASVGPETFAVLLGHVESPGDGERVAAKLARSLQQPFVVAGQPCSVAASVGLAICPQHGREAVELLQRAVAQASGIGTLGGAGAGGPPGGAGGASGFGPSGFAAASEFGGLGLVDPGGAANDDER